MYDPKLMMQAMSFLQTHEPIAIVAIEKTSGKYVVRFTRKIDAENARLIMTAVAEEVSKQ